MSEKKSKKEDIVTFINDPFNLNDAVNALDEIADEMVRDGALEFSDDKEMDEKLENLSSAMEIENERNVKELEALSALEAEASAKELAQQIAEDEALEKELAMQSEELSSLIDEELKAALPKTNDSGEIDVAEIESCIEALLFMSDKPVTLNKLREWIGEDFKKDLYLSALESMKLRYQSVSHGIELIEVAGGYQFRTKPGRSALAKRLAKIQTQRLSRGAMESLTIIAYSQPVMKDEIDKIRGVDSSHFLRTLLDKKLICISGRSELPGRPMLYATTQDFLEIFGLNSLADMPPLREIEAMVPQSESALPDEDPRAAQIRKMLGEMKKDPTRILYDSKEDDEFLSGIREKVKAIPVSTPYLEQMKAEDAQGKQSQNAPETLL